MNEEIRAGFVALGSGHRRWPAKESRIQDTRDALTRPDRIGLLEHCGSGNLGDDATVTTVIQQINSRWPAASIVGLSLDPKDSERRHGIPCFAIRQSVFPFEREWSSGSGPAGQAGYADKLKAALKKSGPLFRAAKAIRKTMIIWPMQFVREVVFLAHALLLACQLDLLVICGGGQLLDWGGPWMFPYTLFKWIALAKCAGAKCVFLNNGAGPLDATLSRWFIRRALSMADCVSLRDRLSREFLRGIGVKREMEVVADCVWSLCVPDALARKRTGPSRRLVIGVAPMAYGDSSRHWVDDDTSYRRLIDSLADFSGRLLQAGHRIALFSSDIWFDSKALADLDAAIHRRYPAVAPGRVTRESVRDTDDLLLALSGVDCYVTCRFHGVVFASLLNVPTLALAPHPKVTTLMEDMGLSDYCVDISRCDANDLQERFDRLITNADEVKARVSRHVAQYRLLLTSQLDGLFGASAENHSEDEHELSIGSVR